MGTISDKLTYLNTTKGLIKDSINLTGANITNDTFRSYAQKLKLGLINALNDNGETIFNNLEKVSGKGSNLSLTPTYEAPIGLKGLYGNTSQNGTPTPSSPIPIESVTGNQNVVISNSSSSNTYEVNLGKNLLDVSQARYGTFGTLTISYSNGQVLLNGNSSSSVDFYVATKVSSPTYNEDLINYMNNNIGDYTLSNNLGYENYFRIGGSYPQNTGTTTSTSKVDLIFVRIPAGTYDNKVLNIQLEKGSQATSYSPYFTPIELNKIGDYEDYIFKNEPNNPLYDDTLTLNSWYITKNIGERTLNGNEEWTYWNNNIFYAYVGTFKFLLNSTGTIGVCDKYKCVDSSATADEFKNSASSYNYAFNFHTQSNYIRIKDTRYTSATDLKTQLQTELPKVYYVMEKPTYTVITNTELIEQLESLYNAKSKNGTTNIVITSQDLAMLMDVSVIKGDA